MSHQQRWHISTQSHFQSCVQFYSRAYSYSSEIWGYLTRGDKIHFERSILSMWIPQQSTLACIARFHVINVITDPSSWLSSVSSNLHGHEGVVYVKPCKFLFSRNGNPNGFSDPCFSSCKETPFELHGTRKESFSKRLRSHLAKLRRSRFLDRLKLERTSSYQNFRV